MQITRVANMYTGSPVRTDQLDNEKGGKVKLVEQSVVFHVYFMDLDIDTVHFRVFDEVKCIDF